MATIQGPAGSVSVKVRDMSPGGALVEGAALPSEGAKVRLMRGTLAILADVAWSHAGRAGLQFVGSIDVTAWLPKAASNAHQNRVDHMVEEVRNSLSGSVLKDEVTPVSQSQVTASEIAEVRRALESLAEDLCEDDTIIVKHASKLQALDKASQILVKLAAER